MEQLTVDTLIESLLEIQAAGYGELPIFLHTHDQSGRVMKQTDPRIPAFMVCWDEKNPHRITLL